MNSKSLHKLAYHITETNKALRRARVLNESVDDVTLKALGIGVGLILSAISGIGGLADDVKGAIRRAVKNNPNITREELKAIGRKYGGSRGEKIVAKEIEKLARKGKIDETRMALVRAKKHLREMRAILEDEDEDYPPHIQAHRNLERYFPGDECDGSIEDWEMKNREWEERYPNYDDHYQRELDRLNKD